MVCGIHCMFASGRLSAKPLLPDFTFFPTALRSSPFTVKILRLGRLTIVLRADTEAQSLRSQARCRFYHNFLLRNQLRKEKREQEKVRTQVI